mmetsp:Transcript_45202/g.104326  ORF Transcript_45202/g.104326 Transcript_45202/m.104326 type:complete len:236 (-) Transcript_45202:418-1125(-)
MLMRTITRLKLQLRLSLRDCIAKCYSAAMAATTMGKRTPGGMTHLCQAPVRCLARANQTMMKICERGKARMMRMMMMMMMMTERRERRKRERDRGACPGAKMRRTTMGRTLRASRMSSRRRPTRATATRMWMASLPVCPRAAPSASAPTPIPTRIPTNGASTRFWTRCRAIRRRAPKKSRPKKAPMLRAAPRASEVLKAPRAPWVLKAPSAPSRGASSRAQAPLRATSWPSAPSA